MGSLNALFKDFLSVKSNEDRNRGKYTFVGKLKNNTTVRRVQWSMEKPGSDLSMMSII